MGAWFIWLIFHSLIFTKYTLTGWTPVAFFNFLLEWIVLFRTILALKGPRSALAQQILLDGGTLFYNAGRERNRCCASELLTTRKRKRASKREHRSKRIKRVIFSYRPRASSITLALGLYPFKPRRRTSYRQSHGDKLAGWPTLLISHLGGWSVIIISE